MPIPLTPLGSSARKQQIRVFTVYLSLTRDPRLRLRAPLFPSLLCLLPVTPKILYFVVLFPRTLLRFSASFSGTTRDDHTATPICGLPCFSPFLPGTSWESDLSSATLGRGLISFPLLSHRGFLSDGTSYGPRDFTDQFPRLYWPS